jgi:hypothetical protein
MDDPALSVAQARQQKEQSFGIPAIEPGQIGPPPNLAQPVPQTSEQQLLPKMSVQLQDIDFGRSVNSKHKTVLAENGVKTLYDAMKLGGSGLESIKGIGAGVSSAIMSEVDHRLV